MKKILFIVICLMMLWSIEGLADWVSPTGFVDPDGQWTDEIKTYDNDTGTYALEYITPQGWSKFLELTHAALWCDKVQFWAYRSGDTITQIDVDVYYNDTWNHVYQGAHSDRAWMEKPLGGTYSVTAARVRFYTLVAPCNAMFHEFDFNETTAPSWDGPFNTVTITKWNNIEITKWNTIE